eukprot:1103800-Amphidinium_carterae.3
MVLEEETLGRRRWLGQVGTTKHVRKLLQEVGLDEANALGTPGARDAEEFEGAEELRTPAEHAAYRHQAGLLQYVSGDRFDLCYSVQELSVY